MSSAVVGDAQELMAAWPSLTDTERAALREILVNGPSSRVEISRTLGVSRANLTRVTRRLIETGLVDEGHSELRARTGRPSEMLQVRASSHTFYGVKLTGDTLFGTLTNLRAEVIAEVEVPLTDHSVQAVVALVADTLSTLEETHGRATAAGVSLAGDIADVDGHPVVMGSVYLGWDQVRLEELLIERLAIPVAVENDVRALTAAEHWFGVGAGCDTMALITVGVGIGLGLVHGGRVVEGVRGRAGRLGHLIINPSGPICGLGHRGCASVYLTNESIARGLGEPGVTYQTVVSRARAGDPAALRAMADAGHALGVLVGVVTDFMDPEKIIITGDGIAVTELAAESIRNAAPGDVLAVLDIRPFEFTEWARGAAVTAIRSLISPPVRYLT